MATGVDLSGVPEHVAIVMDGNGRWAQRRGLKRTDGHAAGEEALFDTVEGGLEIGLRWLTVFAFSTENWRRPLDEVRFLMRFNESLLLRRRDDLNERGVRVRFIGRRTGRVPRRVLRHIEDTEALTRRNRRMTLTFAFNYGGPGRARGCRARDRRRSSCPQARSQQDRRPSAAQASLRTRHARPRHGRAHIGEYRISNYLLWEAAYSELIFTDVLWPDFRREHLFRDAGPTSRLHDVAGERLRIGTIDQKCSSSCRRALGAGRADGPPAVTLKPPLRRRPKRQAPRPAETV